MEPSARGASTPQPTPQPILVSPSAVEHPRTRRPLWAFGAMALLVAGGCLAIIRARFVPSRTGATPVASVALSPDELRQTLRISGTLEAENSVTLLAPRIQGSRSGLNRGGGGGAGPLDFNLVLLRLAKPGSMVRAGDVVGEFDTESQLQRLDDYRDAVVQLEATIQKMKADLAAAEEARIQAVRSAKANWDNAILDLKTASVRSEIDAESLRLTAEENELTYREQLREMVPFEESQRAELRSAEFNLAQARSELERAEKNIAKMTIASPIDGMVVLANVVQNNETRQVREGDQIFAGQPFVSIVDPGAMVLKAIVNQVDAERLRLGMKASVTLDAYPEFRASASLIGIGAMSVTSPIRPNYVGEFPVRLEIDGRDPRLIPDLTGSADITLAMESNVTVAPREAVFGGGTRTSTRSGPAASRI